MTTTNPHLAEAASKPLEPCNPHNLPINRVEAFALRGGPHGSGPMRPLLGIELKEVFDKPNQSYPGLFCVGPTGFAFPSRSRDADLWSPEETIYVTRHPAGWCLPAQNPSGKTLSQDEVDAGYRLVTQFEIDQLAQRSAGVIPLNNVEYWSKSAGEWWSTGHYGRINANYLDCFRTKRPFGDDLTKPVVEYANPANVADILIGKDAGYRLLTVDEIRKFDGSPVHGVDFWRVEGPGSGRWFDGDGIVFVNRARSFRTKRPIGDTLTAPESGQILVSGAEGTPLWKTLSQLEPPSEAATPPEKSAEERLEQIRDLLDRLSDWDNHNLTLGILSDAFRKITAAAYAGYGSVSERPAFKFKLINVG